MQLEDIFQIRQAQLERLSDNLNAAAVSSWEPTPHGTFAAIASEQYKPAPLVFSANKLTDQDVTPHPLPRVLLLQSDVHLNFDKTGHGAGGDVKSQSATSFSPRTAAPDQAKGWNTRAASIASTENYYSRQPDSSQPLGDLRGLEAEGKVLCGVVMIVGALTRSPLTMGAGALGSAVLNGLTLRDRLNRHCGLWGKCLDDN